MMHEHVELAERLRRANPVADPSDPPVGAVGAGIVLLEIERRSTIVQTTDRTKPDTEQSGRRWSGAWIAAAAFAAVIIIVIGFAALFGGRNAGTAPADTRTTTTEPSTTTEAPTTTTEAPTTTTIAAAEPFPGVREPDDELEFGEYAVRTEPISFNFIAPDVSGDFPDGLRWIDQAPMPGPGILPVFDSQSALQPGSIWFTMGRSGDDAETVVADLTAELPASTPVETTVGGRQAMRLDVDDTLGDGPVSSLTDGVAPVVNLLGESFRYRLYVVDSPEGTLVVLVEVTPENADTLLRYWEEIVASIDFTPDGS